MSSGQFVRYDAPGVEPPVADEQAKIESLHNIINRVQRKNFARHRHGFRGTHVKTQAIVKGKLSVVKDLPEHLAQGMFSEGGKEHDIAIRYANEPSFLQDDRAPGPRGCGMKVFGVEGEFLDPAGEETHTQDFTFNNAPLLELTDLPTTLEIFALREKYFDDKGGLEAELKKRKDKDLQFAPQGLPNRHFLCYTMYSQSAYRYGDYVAKYGLFPNGEMQAELEKYEIDDSSDREQHSQWLRQHFQHSAQTYDLRIQLCQSLDEQSVEDCSKAWDEEKYPFHTVAQVVLPSGQDVFDAKRRAFWDDHMKLNVWYGLKAHCPLGSVNRLRKTLYERSAAQRDELNASRSEVVSSIDQIP